ncbi:hypothetical protein CLCR_06639 [Cladophialophora carrionii]|uniref:Elongation of fatty acids protein n=1 Tax=Cladophialophora carrionii TaxID=86049 RepID=A0A1C1CNY6_9EURO|nr:hypothetical protein CLCR_06639 [Cladophialophora carrionii]
MSVSSLVDWLGLGETSPQVKLSTLPLSHFKFPPAPEPTTVPPPPAASNAPALAHPFTVPTDIYNDLLKPQVPITVALVYMSLVSVLNQVNANRGNKPWAISRTRLFKLLVIFHNIFLAAYSAWTCVGTVNALHRSLPALGEEWSVSTTVDALCKLHGPRGAGNAATYNATTRAWTMTNHLFHLAADGLGPEATDAGRMWNEGLAFYGWFFYLSKFYEIVDTLIILAKGRKSSLLQTYHHAGAMLCMWAGIRYMSPPIWMFVLVNSGIHAVMYTFYLLSALGIKVPKWFKQTLTTLQITQFVVGATYAFLHIFVAYQIPVKVPYLYHLGGVASKVVSEAPTEVTSSVASTISTAANYGAWLKKAVLRGAGYEGLAENVLNEQGKPFGVDAVHTVEDAVRREETRYRDELQWAHCLDTSGQVFAILLNCVYLLPLTWLFLQFFIQAYIKQTERRRSRSASDAAVAARNSFLDASKGVSRRLSQAVQEMHNVSEDIGDDTVFVDGDEIRREMREAAEQAKNAIKRGENKVKSSVKNSGISPEAVKQEFDRDIESAGKTLQDTADKVKNAAAKAGDAERREQISAKVQSLEDSAADAVEKAVDSIKSVAGSAREQAAPAVNYASEKAGELKDQAEPTVNAAADKAAELKDRAFETAKSTAGDAKASIPESVDEAKESGQQASASAKQTAENAADQAKEAASTTADEAKESAQKAGNAAEETAQTAEETAEATVESASSKAEDLSREIQDSLEQGTPSGEGERSEVDKFTSQNQESNTTPETKSPNGNGTGADEVPGQSQSEGRADESEQTKAEKKEEDQIIDESQVVRDEDVDANTQTNGDGSGDAEEATATSAQGAGSGDRPSFADMLKKGDEEGDEVEGGDKDKEDKEKDGWGI